MRAIKELVSGLIGILLLVLLLYVLGMISKSTQKYTDVQDHCLNSACEKPCSEIKRFKRHEGCVK